MAPIRLREHDLAHIAVMIGLLERLIEDDGNVPANVVFEPDYWQARLEAVLAGPHCSSPLAARASTLLARLDTLRGMPAPPESDN